MNISIFNDSPFGATHVQLQDHLGANGSCPARKWWIHLLSVIFYGLVISYYLIKTFIKKHFTAQLIDFFTNFSSMFSRVYVLPRGGHYIIFQQCICIYRHVQIHIEIQNFASPNFLYFHTQERAENLTHEYISTVYMCI